jgi:hypothetical protein
MTSRRHTPKEFWRGLTVTFLGLLSLLFLTGGTASAAFSHNALTNEFSISGSPCQGEITDMAADETRQYVYVVCDSSTFGTVIARFDYQGNPANFSASGSYLTNNLITENPGEFADNLANFYSGTRIAVDNSGANNGYLYASTAIAGQHANVEAFRPSGDHVATLEPEEVLEAVYGVAVGPDGSVYVAMERAPGQVLKYDPAFHLRRTLYTHDYSTVETNLGFRTRDIAVDPSGGTWLRTTYNIGGEPGAGEELNRYEADQYTTTRFPNDSPADEMANFLAKPSPAFPPPLLTEGVRGLAMDLGTGELFVDQGDGIAPFTHGTAEEVPYQHVPTIGAGTLLNSRAIAVTADHHVFAATEFTKVAHFGPGDLVPDVRTDRPQVDDVGHTTATLRGRVEPAGGGPITACAIEYGLDTKYEAGEVPCEPDPAASPPGSNFTGDQDVSGELTALTTGATYHYRFRAENANGANFGIDRALIPAFVIGAKTLPATAIDLHGATLNGSYEADGLETTYHFEYGKTASYGVSTPNQPVAAAPGVSPASAAIASLPSGKTFHYRLVASNENGTTFGPDLTFSTAAPPDISGAQATEIAATSAVLHARVNPLGYSTHYRFEYGTSPAFGQSVPLPDLAIGSGTAPVDVSQSITGLQAGTTYHFRVFAESQWGMSTSPDTTFDFAPPSCPNGQLRQQTGAGFLPDCRAYELVSPGRAGPVYLWPSSEVTHREETDQYGRSESWTLNTGRATSPPRFSFFGGFGSIAGLDTPAGAFDMYVATRTQNGWQTTYPWTEPKHGSPSRHSAPSPSTSASTTTAPRPANPRKTSHICSPSTARPSVVCRPTSTRFPTPVSSTGSSGCRATSVTSSSPPAKKVSKVHTIL